ncbi:hypothetical protein [Robertmurraya massiliosenegalensis]|uniref:hypothetical protein n=1 Tax=Robertmurraya massiliosenegalensis TaxID=1287657 RepID=UPI0002E7D947|nr:hypothetical protein [Robertmurraya massiliosenegalensis]
MKAEFGQVEQEIGQGSPNRRGIRTERAEKVEGSPNRRGIRTGRAGKGGRESE